MSDEYYEYYCRFTFTITNYAIATTLVLYNDNYVL